ncbi:MAG: lysophospholipase [Bacteroidales bacterium]|nr:lysophospholipase [Bacteroidales bacterium]
MQKSQQSYITKDNKEIVYYKHIPETDAKAIVIITHGMAEHAQRYDEFAGFLNKNAYIVYAHDQRGHGKTAGSVEKLGFFAEKDGWQKVTDDLAELVEISKKEHQNIPIFLLGHSMGSFIVRTFILQHSDKVNGAILSGTAGSAGLLGFAGSVLTGIIILFKKKSSPSSLMDKLSFGDFNKAFKPNRTDFDWLSRDNESVDKYVADPYCGTIFSVGFFNNLINGLELINKLKIAEKVRNDLPMYLFAGDKDPVSKNGKQVSDVYNMYKKAGITDIEMKLYPDARHETLNETNKEEVFSDVLTWLNSKTV